MHRSIVGAALIAAALQLCATHSFAVDAKQPKSPHPAASGPPTMAGQAIKPKKAARPANVKLVDINTAGKAELKKLPGIGDAQADQIIAKRPFGSKADLTTRGIVPEGIYLMLKDRVIARQKPGSAAQPRK